MTVTTESTERLPPPATEPRVFDSWINIPYLPGEVTPDPSVVQRFKRGNSAYEGGETMADVIAEMDRLDISGGVLTKVPRDITPPYVHGIRNRRGRAARGVRAARDDPGDYPGRFVTSVGVDPRLGYEAAKHVRIAVREYGIKAIRICPMFTGIAIDDKLAYPLYTAACDEGAVVTINVGVPGPMKPAKLQRTILVDEVALAFPDLKIVMTHLGDPWISETVAMLVKHPNVFAMTAGWAPKYVPEAILDVLRGARRPSSCGPRTTRSCRSTGPSPRAGRSSCRRTRAPTSSAPTRWPSSATPHSLIA